MFNDQLMCLSHYELLKLPVLLFKTKLHPPGAFTVLRIAIFLRKDKAAKLVMSAGGFKETSGPQRSKRKVEEGAQQRRVRRRTEEPKGLLAHVASYISRTVPWFFSRQSTPQSSKNPENDNVIESSVYHQSSEKYR